MAQYTIDLKRPPKHIHAVPLIEHGTNPSGDHISFTNYYMQRNDRPFFGVCGEFHYARYP